jgi:hypothetical protein
MAGKRPAGASHAGFVPSSERVYGIRVVHRERADLTALTELFVRFTLAQANANRAEEPARVVRPETLKPDLHLDSTAQEATITTRPQSSGP